jgi:hypothetical protein
LLGVQSGIPTRVFNAAREQEHFASSCNQTLGQCDRTVFVLLAQLPSNELNDSPKGYASHSTLPVKMACKFHQIGVAVSCKAADVLSFGRRHDEWDLPSFEICHNPIAVGFGYTGLDKFVIDCFACPPGLR